METAFRAAFLLKVRTLLRHRRLGSRRSLQIVVVVASFLLCDTTKKAIAQSFNSISGAAAGEIEPPIATSAVAGSGNCDRVMHLADELQGQIDAVELQPKPPLTPADKFRLALKNFSDPVNIGGRQLRVN
jgi:hypothetical protein